MTTSISIKITETPDATEAVRKRVSLPATDEAALAWWEAQDNPSLSVRLLIHEESKGFGAIDRVNRIGARVPDLRDTKIASLEAEIAGLRQMFAPFLTALGHPAAAVA